MFKRGHYESQSLSSQEEVPLGNLGDFGSKSLSLINSLQLRTCHQHSNSKCTIPGTGVLHFLLHPKLPPLTTCLSVNFLSSLVRTIFSVRSLFNPFHKEIAQSGLREILEASKSNHVRSLFEYILKTAF